MRKLFLTIIVLAVCSITYGQNIDEEIQKNKKEVKAVETEFFITVEKMPSFPGGEEELMKFLAENLEYPQDAREKGIQGKVYVTFIVEADGSVSNVKVLRDIGGGCGDEAARVVKTMPKWEPGKQKGKAVRVQYNLPVKFVL